MGDQLAMCGPLRNAWRDVESNNVEAVKRWNGQHTFHHGRASYLSVKPLLMIKRHVCIAYFFLKQTYNFPQGFKEHEKDLVECSLIHVMINLHNFQFRNLTTFTSSTSGNRFFFLRNLRRNLDWFLYWQLIAMPLHLRASNG